MSSDPFLVVIDPHLEAQPALTGAIEAARVMGADLHLYACLEAAATPEELAAMGVALEGMAARATAAGLTATTELERDADWQVQVVRAAARCGATLIVKYSFDHSELQRMLRETSDWTLLRTASCPVLLVKGKRPWAHQRVLGAINVNSRDGAHTRLNNLVISVTRRIANVPGAQAHFIHACEAGQPEPDVAAVARRCGVPESQLHISHGLAHEVIANAAEALAVDIVVIGTVGRSGLVGKWIGNTAERVLDHTHVDLLVVN